MDYLSRALSVIGGQRIILALGGLYITLGVGWTLVQVTGGTPPSAVLIQSLLVTVPGGLLLYGGYQLPKTEIHAPLYPFIAEWVLVGFGVLLGVVGVIELISGLDRPVYTVQLATALGSVGGFGIGRYAAQAKTRALEAEQYSTALEHANDRLEMQHQRLESFAGMLAHELRNPLSIAQIYLQTAKDGDASAFEQVETAHDRIEEMIDILLVTVRGTSDSNNVESVPIADTATVAWAAVTTDAVGGELVVDTERTVQADPAHLRYLFRQLFRNSLEYGGEDVTVRVGDLDDRDGFYIEDDGPGIPEDTREDVLEAGFSTKAGGHGLGLSFVAQLAETYDWEWTITESTTGGARFEFTDLIRVSTEGGIVPVLNQRG